jgi:hypothetical protein
VNDSRSDITATRSSVRVSYYFESSVIALQMRRASDCFDMRRISEQTLELEHRKKCNWAEVAGYSAS